jgi:uncharacterized RDD family membrane protein YckC
MESTLKPAGVICSVCKNSFSANEVVQYNNDTVCFNCKNEYFQKVREGVTDTTTSGIRYSSVRRRFAAMCVDAIILGIFNMIIMFSFAGAIAANPTDPNPSALFGRMAITMVFSALLGVAYYTVLHGWKGATFGKMIFKIRVVKADGDPISYVQAFVRYLGYMLSSLTLCIGYIIAIFDSQKRSLHDRIAGTRVIYS